MSAQGPQYFGTRKHFGEEARFRENTAAQTPLPTRGTMFTKPLPGGRVLDPRKQRRSSFSRPHYPFELYPVEVGNEIAWCVYPGSVNGTIAPKIGGLSIFSVPVPILTFDQTFSAYLEFDVKGETKMVEGTWITLPGKPTLTNVEIATYSEDDVPLNTPIVIDPETGTATPGHRIYKIGSVAGGQITDKSMRFSVYFSLCYDGNLIMSEYG